MKLIQQLTMAVAQGPSCFCSPVKHNGPFHPLDQHHSVRFKQWGSLPRLCAVSRGLNGTGLHLNRD